MFLNDVHNELYDKELAWDEWHSRFDSICNVHAPLASRRIKDSSKPWIDPEMTLKFLARDYAKDMYDKTGDQNWKTQQKTLANECRMKLNEKKQTFFYDAERIGKSKPK